jgi:hypothetical protein
LLLGGCSILIACLKVAVESLQALFLVLGEQVVVHIHFVGVALAARLHHTPAVEVGATASEAALDELVVVVCSQFIAHEGARVVL